MPKKSLKETNPYLKDPEKRKALIYTTVTSSTAIETGYIVSDWVIQPSKKPKKEINFADPEGSFRSHR